VRFSSALAIVAAVETSDAVLDPEVLQGSGLSRRRRTRAAVVNIKKAQPLTQDGAVLLAGTMKVQALVTHPRKTGAHRPPLQLLDSSF